FFSVRRTGHAEGALDFCPLLFGELFASGTADAGIKDLVIDVVRFAEFRLIKVVVELILVEIFGGPTAVRSFYEFLIEFARWVVKLGFLLLISRVALASKFLSLIGRLLDNSNEGVEHFLRAHRRGIHYNSILRWTQRRGSA